MIFLKKPVFFTFFGPGFWTLFSGFWQFWWFWEFEPGCVYDFGGFAGIGQDRSKSGPKMDQKWVKKRDFLVKNAIFKIPKVKISSFPEIGQNPGFWGPGFGPPFWGFWKARIIKGQKWAKTFGFCLDRQKGVKNGSKMGQKWSFLDHFF